MINRLLTILFILFFYNNCLAQNSKQNDLYLYFKTDSLNGVYKTVDKLNVYEKDRKKTVNMKEIDVYHYSYISADGKRKMIYKLFSTLNKNQFCVRDTSLFNDYRILPYKKLENINGLISDEWNRKNFQFRRVFIVEKISKNQFRYVQVQLYFPFHSDGVIIKRM